MTMAESGAQSQRAGVEQPLTAAVQLEQQPQTDQRAAAVPWFRRTSFWRAVAGMAAAIALGCALVALETASELSSTSTYFHHRLGLLGSRASLMRAQIEDVERELTAMKADRTARANLDRILAAPDAKLMRLRPAAARNAKGLILVSKQAGEAVCEVAGLPAAADRIYVMWWLPVRGEPAIAAQFQPRPDDHLSVVVQMPAHGTAIAGAIVTLEAAKPLTKPIGPVVLKGALPKPRALS